MKNVVILDIETYEKCLRLLIDGFTGTQDKAMFTCRIVYNYLIEEEEESNN